MQVCDEPYEGLPSGQARISTITYRLLNPYIPGISNPIVMLTEQKLLITPI